MEPPSFRGKPSEDHVIWRRAGAGAEGAKRFDESRLKQWCERHGVNVETSTRVDHDRSDQPRDQFRLVFAWSESEQESFDLGEEEWELSTGKTPRTFVEIDEAGEARVKGWSTERVLDVRELRIDGTGLVVEAAEFDGTKRLDAERLRSEPE